MEKYEITLFELSTNNQTSISIKVDEAESTDNIIIHSIINEIEITAENYNYFSAFQSFRDKLLKMGYGIKCNGSRLNAVQSGMMSATDKVYLIELGKKASMNDIAYTWDYAEIDSFPDTSKQNMFFDQWLKSQ